MYPLPTGRIWARHTLHGQLHISFYTAIILSQD